MSQLNQNMNKTLHGCATMTTEYRCLIPYNCPKDGALKSILEEAEEEAYKH